MEWKYNTPEQKVERESELEDWIRSKNTEKQRVANFLHHPYVFAIVSTELVNKT